MGTARYVVGLDVGGTSVNATVLDDRGQFLVDRLIEHPSRVVEGPPAALAAIGEAMAAVLAATGVARSDVAAVGLDTPGPASADGVISSRGATNFSAPEWWGYDVRKAAEDLFGVPVVYNNDGNAAALYAHRQHFGPAAMERSSVAAIVGTGFGGGVIESGQVVRGASGMAGELGHVPIPMEGLLEHDQFVPLCNCGGAGDVESVASLSGITNNLLPYWLARHADHPLHAVESIGAAARQVRALAEHGDEMALQIFAQQAQAIGRFSRWPATSPTRTRISSVAVSWRRNPTSGRGSWSGCRKPPSCATSNAAWRRSPLYPTWTWPVPAARRSPPFKLSLPETSVRRGAEVERGGELGR